MIFGNINGLVDGTEKVIFDSTVTGTSTGTVTTGTIKYADEADYYTIFVRQVAANAVSTRVSPNGDIAASYGYRGISAKSTTLTAVDQSSTLYGFPLFVSQTVGNTAFQVFKVYSKPGVERQCDYIATYDVFSTVVTYAEIGRSVWVNTAATITNFLFSGGTGAFGVGSRFIVTKANNFTDGIPAGKITANQIQGSWVRVGSSVLSATASTVSISGLDGNRDVIYYFNSEIKASATGYPSILPNGTSSNKGEQYMTASGTAATAARNTTEWAVDYSAINNGNVGQISGYIFAPTGAARHILLEMTNNTTGVLAGRVTRMGGVWNETSTNITSLSWAGSVAGMFGIGSKFEVYALRPNG